MFSNVSYESQKNCTSLQNGRLSFEEKLRRVTMFGCSSVLFYIILLKKINKQKGQRMVFDPAAHL